MKEKTEWYTYGVLAEAAFFATLYYVQYLLSVEGNLWISTLILWVLINASIILCPVVRKCYK